MNVSMQDGFNLGWKLGHVLEGRSPKSLLSTYTAERQVIAQNLIDFDREWSSMMAAKTEELESPTALEEFYVKTMEFPAGFMTQYEPSMITAEQTHQDLAAGFPIGKRFKSVEVIRKSEGNPKHLGHLHTADGRWRIYVFADKNGIATDSKTAKFAEWLGNDANSPVVAHRKDGEDINALFDVKVIYQESYTDIELTDVPDIFKPANGPFGLINLENVFAANPEHDIFDIRELSRDGVVVVVRPDMYVANVLPLDATEELADFFRPIFTVE